MRCATARARRLLQLPAESSAEGCAHCGHPWRHEGYALSEYPWGDTSRRPFLPTSRPAVAYLSPRELMRGRNSVSSSLRRVLPRILGGKRAAIAFRFDAPLIDMTRIDCGSAYPVGMSMSEPQIEAWWDRLDPDVQDRLLMEAETLDAGLDLDLVDQVNRAGPVVSAAAWMGEVLYDETRGRPKLRGPDEFVFQLDDDVREWVLDRARAEFAE